MTTIRLFAEDLRLRIVSPICKVASGNQNSVELKVDFTSHWANVNHRTAVFFTAADPTAYEVFLDNGKCAVPHEVLAKPGELLIGIRGVNPEGQVIRATTLVKYRIESGAPAGDGTVVEPTPDVYQQILAKLKNVGGNVDLTGYATEQYVKDYAQPKGNYLNDVQIRQAIANYLRDNPVQTGSTAAIGTVNLLAANWVGSENLYSQVVTIEGVTENSQVDLTPSVEQLVVFYEKDLTLVTENDGGVVTVYAIGQKPTNDYTIQVTITEVSV